MRARLLARMLLVGVVLVIVVYAVAFRTDGTPAPTGSSPTSSSAFAAATYPRLANYNGLQDPWQIPFFADDDLVVASRGAPVRQLARANPHVTTLLYERTLQVDLCCSQSLYGLKTADVPPQWWLLTAGSTLAGPINATQTLIPVTNPRPFKRCQDVLVDGENMHIWGVDGHWLHVLRGYYSKAVPHHVGAHIAPHYSYRTDLSNCTIYGPVTSVRPWSFNMSSLCPRWHGQRWIDYLAHYVADLVRRDGWSGVFYDNLQDFPPAPDADTAGSGHADGGIVDGVNVWRAGERALLAETRKLLPGSPILVNGDLRIDGGLADGREMEGFPLIPGAALYAGIDAYEYDAQADHGHTIVNPDTVTRLTPSPSSVEAAVGVSLLGDGYVAYDRGWLTHGDPWWFDEYDGGQGTALTARVDAAATLLPVVHAGRFHPGDVVLVDQEAMKVRRVLKGKLLVQRGVDGTTPIWHIARTTVTTAQQRAAGHGYLGRALGPARLVKTGDWAHHFLPLAIAPTGSQSGGHVQAPNMRPIDRSTMLEMTPTLHYHADAVTMTLSAPHDTQAQRTLVFYARGPAGATLWFDDGDPTVHVTGAPTTAATAAVSSPTAVPLTLRSTWHRYAIPVGGTGQFVFGLGRVGGHIQIKGLQLIGAQAYVLRRDFSNGIVLVNPTDRTQHVRLEKPYRILSGDANPWANSGRVVRTIAIARYRAAILLNVKK